MVHSESFKSNLLQQSVAEKGDFPSRMLWTDLSEPVEESLSGGIQSTAPGRLVGTGITPTATATQKIRIRLKSYDHPANT